MTVADDVLALALSRPPALGSGRLICLDGPSGSGKSELAREIARLTRATIVRTDDLCPGWDGIPMLAALIADLLRPLAEDRPGSYPRYDWIAGRTAETVLVAPAPLLVLEGVGAGGRGWSDLTAVLVWLDAPEEVRRERAIARDGEYFREHWAAWARAERAFFADQDVQVRADLAFDTTA